MTVSASDNAAVSEAQIRRTIFAMNPGEGMELKKHIGSATRAITACTAFLMTWAANAQQPPVRQPTPPAVRPVPRPPTVPVMPPQTPPIVTPGVPPVGHGASGETEEQTIHKNLVDLRSNSAEVRKRAVIILGKYQNPQAQRAVVECLQDRAAEVRQAALVSLSEQRLLPQNAAVAVLELLDDPDIHVRRIASSIIPECMMLMTRAVDPQSGKVQTNFPPPVVKAVNAAFADADATVRKNMLTHFHYFEGTVPDKLVIDLLTDADRDNRILALQAARRMLAPALYVRTVAPMAADKDRLIRMHLAQSLRMVPSEESTDIMKKLEADADAEVAGHAVLALVAWNQFDNSERLRQVIDQPNLNAQLAVRIIHLLPNLGDESHAVLKHFLKHERAVFRAAAIQAYTRAFAEGIASEELLPLVNDDSADVREAAVNALLSGKKLDQTGLMKLAASPYDDVRRQLVNSARFLEPAEAGQLLNEMLFDQDDNTRKVAIAEIARQRIDGWQDILMQSLADNNEAIQEVAVRHLVQVQTPEIKQALDEFAKTTKNMTLRTLIAARKTVNQPPPAPVQLKPRVR